MDEIASATEILSQTVGCRVVVVNDLFVVKHGAQVDLLGGQTQLFLQQSSSVPVPRVYALFQNTTKKGVKCSYIVMEHIKGTVLSSLWPSMNETGKQATVSKLRTIFDNMRTLKSPGGYCSVGRGGLPDVIFWKGRKDQYGGPFDTEAELNAAVVDRYTVHAAYKGKSAYYARAFEMFFQCHPPVFTHADFQQKKVVLRHPSSPGAEVGAEEIENAEVVLIDWEFAGWYPSYWEHSRAVFACGRWEGDWHLQIEKILDPFWNESAWVCMMLGELWS